MKSELRTRIEKTGKRALERWGFTAQMNQFQEECAALIVAISHVRRKHADLDAVASAIADVIIVAEQARLIMPERVEKALEHKLNRLEERLS